MFLRGTLFILNFVGLSPLSTGAFSKLRCVIFCLSLALFCLGIIAGAIQTYEGMPTLIRLSEGIPGILQSVWKAGVMLNHRKELAEVTRSVDTFWRSDLISDEEKAEVEALPGIATRCLKFYYLFTALVLILFMLSPHMQGSSNLPLIFFMEGVQPYHIYMYVFLIYSWILVAYMMAAFEGLFIYYAVNIIREYGIIRHVFDGKAKVPVAFVDNVEHHCLLIRLVKKLSDIYQSMFMTMILTTFCWVCFGLFLMTRNGLPPSLEDFSKYSGLIIFTSVQIAIYCVIGQLLVDESLKIADVFFEKDWPSMHPYQNAFGRMMVMRMSQKGQRLSVGGYFALDLNTCTWMAKNAVSFLTFMQALSKKM